VRGLPAIVLLVGTLALFQAAAPAHACACGAPAPVADDPNGDVLIDHEYAIISLHGDQEQVDMRLSLQTMADESGLIMPTPAPATVSLGDATAFDDLAVQMTPEFVTTYDWWSFEDFMFRTGSAPPGGGAPPVQVLSSVQLGPLQAVTLAASDASGLTEWLNANGFGIRDAVKPMLQTYIDQGWYFAALKLTNSSTLDGDIDPIRFTFDEPATGLVYPLALSQAARESQTVNLYVFDDHQHDVMFTNGQPLDEVYESTPRWAGPVDQPSLLEYGSYLTAYSLYFWDPGTEIHGDLVFPQSSQDQPVGQVIYDTVHVTVLGFPVGWLIVVAALVVGILVVLMVRDSRRQASKSRSYVPTR